MLLFVGVAFAVPICPPPSGDDPVLLPDPTDCTHYYQCVGETPILEACQPGLEWDNKNHRCDWPEVAQCTETESKPPTTPTVPTTHPTGSTTPKPTKCPEDQGEEEILIKNPEDCHSFFKCYKGKPILIKCPPGQEWADELNRCDWPEVAHCTIESSTQAF